MKILIISPIPTHPTTAGNRSCILAYSKLLIDMGHDVYYLYIYEHISSENERISQMRDFWGNKLFIFQVNFINRIKKIFYKYFRFRLTSYYKVDDWFPIGLNRYVKKINKKINPDVVIVNYIFYSKVFLILKNVKKLLYTHDVFTNKFQKTGLRWFSVKPNQEAKALERADSILAIQNNEAIFLSYLTTKKVYTTYSYFPIHNTPYVNNYNLLFIAGPNEHNIEGIMQFINQTLPSIVKINKSIKLIIGGKICEKIKFHNNNVILLGEVQNLLDFFKLGNIFINPVYNGTGLKIKLFEALSYGKVVVSHPHNLEGIFNRSDSPIICAINKEEYSENIKKLFSDKSLIIEKKKQSIQYIDALNKQVTSEFIKSIENR